MVGSFFLLQTFICVYMCVDSPMQPTSHIAMKHKAAAGRGHPPKRKNINKVVPQKTGDAGAQKKTATKQKEKEVKKKMDSADVSLLYSRCIIFLHRAFLYNCLFLVGFL